LPIAASTVTDAAVSAGPLLWAALIAFLAVMVVVDLRVGAAGQEMTTRRAATWSAIWLGLALAFGAGLWILAGGEAGETYLAGYAMEKSLSLIIIVPHSFLPHLSTRGVWAQGPASAWAFDDEVSARQP